MDLFPDVAKGLRDLKDKGYLLLVITNQSGVARGKFTLDDVHKCHQEISRQLELEGVTIDGWFICPHHKAGTVAPYNVECDCRKPEIGMLLQASKEFTIDFENSFVIGDKTSDIDTGKNFNPPLRGIQIDRKMYELHESPWRMVDSFQMAVKSILDSSREEG